MSKFEAAWLDIDQTLLIGDNRPSEDVLSALAKIPQLGVNTQRSLGQAEKVILPEELNLPSIVLSGAEVWEIGKRMIKAFPIPEIERIRLADEAIRQNPGKIVLARFYPAGDRHVTLFVATPEMRTKFTAIYQQTDSLGYVTQSLTEFCELLKTTPTGMLTLRCAKDTKLDLSADLLARLELDNSQATDYVFNAKGVRKATTLLWLCEHLGIDPTKVLTAGDNANTDSEVFQHTYGISVGPQNLPHAKENVPDIPALAARLSEIFS